MKRAIKLTLICPIEIDDDVDVSDEKALDEAEADAVNLELFTTDNLCNWNELDIEDIGEWED